jgi:prepilin-type N-terminal cleavage/methylation domain-containing protein
MRKGFTAIELMICISVVAIILAIIFGGNKERTEREKKEYIELMKKQDPKKYERLQQEEDKKKYEELQKKFEEEK